MIELVYFEQFYWLRIERGLFVLVENIVTLHAPPTNRRIENTRNFENTHEMQSCQTVGIEKIVVRLIVK